jgi:hypothetical protein
MPTVKGFVGEFREHFDLSREAVRLAMPSTEIVLNGLGQGDTHNTLLLPQADPAAFEYLREWATTTEIELPHNDGGGNSSLFWSILK